MYSLRLISLLVGAVLCIQQVSAYEASSQNNNEIDLQKHIIGFEKFLLDRDSQKKKKIVNFNSMTSNEQIQFVRMRQIEKKYVEGEKFKVTLNFYNKDNFPVKYAAVNNQFKKDTSPTFYEEKSNEIFLNTMGSEYEIYDPHLRAVTVELIVVETLVSGVDELRELLILDNLKSVYHGGDHPILEEVY